MRHSLGCAAGLIETLVLRRIAELDPALDLAFDAHTFDTGKRGDDARPPLRKVRSKALQ